MALMVGFINVALVVLVILMILGLLVQPFIAALLLGIFIFIGYEWISIDNRIEDFLKERHVADVEIILDHLGYAKNNMSDCSFITCVTYETLIDLRNDGVIQLQFEGELTLASKIIWLPSKN